MCVFDRTEGTWLSCALKAEKKLGVNRKDGLASEIKCLTKFTFHRFAGRGSPSGRENSRDLKRDWAGNLGFSTLSYTSPQESLNAGCSVRANFPGDLLVPCWLHRALDSPRTVGPLHPAGNRS